MSDVLDVFKEDGAAMGRMSRLMAAVFTLTGELWARVTRQSVGALLLKQVGLAPSSCLFLKWLLAFMVEEKNVLPSRRFQRTLGNFYKTLQTLEIYIHQIM